MGHLDIWVDAKKTEKKWKTRTKASRKKRNLKTSHNFLVWLLLEKQCIEK